MTDQTAPGRLELVREFVNTRDVEEGTDALGSEAELAAWLDARDLAPPGSARLGDADRDRLGEVRETLRSLLLANNAGAPPPPLALEKLNHESSEAAIGLRFEPAGASLVTTCDGVDAVIARLLAIVHESMNDGTWSRLKACPADDCLWAFYDHSRNRSGTWCSMEECGNRAKARAYRERRRAEPGGSASR
jgi:predicted RNA-binding Zn ribbon-like protein